MQDASARKIRQAYLSRGPDKDGLFETLLREAEECGLEEALRVLEGCVLQKRSRWLKANLAKFEIRGDPFEDASRLFYQAYLGLSMPQDGQVVERTAKQLVTRWWNPCPTLEACQQHSLDTRLVCRLAYHRPVQIFMDAIRPSLRFERNYACLRPHTPYCEELIVLEG